MDKAVLSVHCHNDLGLAVANSVAAVRAGARQVEVTVNGIGERAGNASLEEFVMALTVRSGRPPLHHRASTPSQIWNTSRLLANTIGFPIPRNKPITGENAFAHESGIHQDGVLKKRETYEIMTPESVGRDAQPARPGPSLGPARVSKPPGGARHRLDARTRRRRRTSGSWRSRTARRKSTTTTCTSSSRTSWATRRKPSAWITSTSSRATSPFQPRRCGSSPARERFEEAATGDGPVDAIFNAIDRALGVDDKAPGVHGPGRHPGQARQSGR